MDELVNQLETRLKVLVHSYENLKLTQSALIREKDSLLAKNKIAVAHIENMVTRLKSIEKLS